MPGGKMKRVDEVGGVTFEENGLGIVEHGDWFLMVIQFAGNVLDTFGSCTCLSWFGCCLRPSVPLASPCRL
jgi:hypothetical protein